MKFLAFVLFEILTSLVSMQNYLNTKTADIGKIMKYAIHFVSNMVSLAVENVVSLT